MEAGAGRGQRKEEGEEGGDRDHWEGEEGEERERGGKQDARKRGAAPTLAKGKHFVL